MIRWNGNNLKDLIEFTGKCEDFDSIFPTWEDYESHVKREGNTFKVINPDGSELAFIGDWVCKYADGTPFVIPMRS